jgi:hypothetical protein
MSEEVNFKYFFNGEEVDKSIINWDEDVNVKVVKDVVYVTSKLLGYLSTRHKHPPGGYNKKD